MVYEEHPNARSSSLRRGFFAGLLIGAGLGLLFSPKPGWALRRSMVRSLQELRRRALEVRQQSREQISRLDDGEPHAHDRTGDSADSGHQREDPRETAERVSETVETQHRRAGKVVDEREHPLAEATCRSTDDHISRT